ncbi:MAG: hypothetical protein LIO57_00960 [Oscillospiraceae bacterium]|nr:hypothetical protein [Oscillospiraceae bacterium]
MSNDTNTIQCKANQNQNNTVQDNSKSNTNQINTGSAAATPLTPAPFTPPSVSEVADFAAKEKLPDDAQNFCDYYTSNGWLVGGKAPMRDWQASYRRWCKNKPHGGETAPAAAPPENIDWDKERQHMASVYAVLSGKDT